MSLIQRRAQFIQKDRQHFPGHQQGGTDGISHLRNASVVFSKSSCTCSVEYQASGTAISNHGARTQPQYICRFVTCRVIHITLHTHPQHTNICMERQKRNAVRCQLSSPSHGFTICYRKSGHSNAYCLAAGGRCLQAPCVWSPIVSPEKCLTKLDKGSTVQRPPVEGSTVGRRSSVCSAYRALWLHSRVTGGAATAGCSLLSGRQAVSNTWCRHRYPMHAYWSAVRSVEFRGQTGSGDIEVTRTGGSDDCVHSSDATLTSTLGLSHQSLARTHVRRGKGWPYVRHKINDQSRR